ncbi:MAG: helix-turn-helix transcriptional regulator [Lachnospiraceae bacterium]|nr:helix-turn-helix transcriptional regulator [Lachnospiraceae bacterium]
MADISNNIKRLRLSRGWNQSQLAEKAGVTRQTISNWENGSSFPDIGMVGRLADAFGTDMDELLYPPSAPKKSRTALLTFRFVLMSLAAYLFLFYVIGANLILPLFRKIGGGGVGEDWHYMTHWGLILLVGFIAVCTGIITEYIKEK